MDVFWTEVFGSAVPAVRCCASVSCVCVIELGGRLDIVDSGVLDEVLCVLEHLEFAALFGVKVIRSYDPLNQVEELFDK